MSRRSKNSPLSREEDEDSGGLDVYSVSLGVGVCDIVVQDRKVQEYFDIDVVIV